MKTRSQVDIFITKAAPVGAAFWFINIFIIADLIKCFSPLKGEMARKRQRGFSPTVSTRQKSALLTPFDG